MRRAGRDQRRSGDPAGTGLRRHGRCMDANAGLVRPRAATPRLQRHPGEADRIGRLTKSRSDRNHPGETTREDCVEALGLTVGQAAAHFQIEKFAVTAICADHRLPRCPLRVSLRQQRRHPGSAYRTPMTSAKPVRRHARSRGPVCHSDNSAHQGMSHPDVLGWQWAGESPQSRESANIPPALEHDYVTGGAYGAACACEWRMARIGYDHSQAKGE